MATINKFKSNFINFIGFLSNENTAHAGDPGVMFFEFELLIARIALDSYPKDLDKKGVPSMSDVIERYFSYLMFRKN